MVWFTFTFLLGIPNDNEEKLEDNSKKTEEKFQVDFSYQEIEVSKPNFLCHIEYVLIPQDAPKFIDVVCWSEAAKIYFENSTCAIIPLKVDKLKWIHFRVNHNIKLKLDEVPLFRSHSIKFSIRLGNKNFGEPAKSDKPKKFYGPKFSDTEVNSNIQKQMFQPLSESLEDLRSVSYFKEHLTPQQQLYISLDTTIETSESYNKLYEALFDLSNEYHDEKCEKKPSPPWEDIPPLLNILEQQGIAETTNSKKGKENKTDKKNTVKNKEVEKMEFSITGEQFFSGIKVFENCLKYNAEELPYVFCLGTVKDPLSEAQAAVYNPLSIIISSLNFVPVVELKKHGITKLKFRFLVCNQLLAESNLIPIEKQMKINLARTIFTHILDKQELIHFIQTGGVNIEILGNGDESQLGLENAGVGFRDLRDTKNKKEVEEKFITLGRVSADISSVLLQPHRALMKCNIQIPNAPWEKKTSDSHISTNEFNSCLKKERMEDMHHYFIQSGTILTLRAGLGYPLTKTWKTVTANPNLFNRLFVVLKNLDLAVPIIQIIQDEADEIVGLTDYTKNGKNLKRPLTKNNKGDSENGKCVKNGQITGFLIDCADKILLYAESSVFGGVQKVWACTSGLSPLQGHVLYDSSLIFLDRLYENLFQFGGFMGITLKESPHAILSKSQSYSNKSIPEPAQKALRCLSLLTDCKSIKTATQNNLFPDFDSLASLAIEFGAPIRISNESGLSYSPFQIFAGSPVTKSNSSFPLVAKIHVFDTVIMCK